jgi:hypothetical protein
MQWTYQGENVEEIPDGVEAFVYLITNKVNGMKYVGKIQDNKAPAKRQKKQKTWNKRIRLERLLGIQR